MLNNALCLERLEGILEGNGHKTWGGDTHLKLGEINYLGLGRPVGCRVFHFWNFVFWSGSSKLLGGVQKSHKILLMFHIILAYKLTLRQWVIQRKWYVVFYLNCCRHHRIHQRKVKLITDNTIYAPYKWQFYSFWVFTFQRGHMPVWPWTCPLTLAVTLKKVSGHLWNIIWK